MIKIFLTFKSLYLKTEMEYRLNFWMSILSGVVMRAVMLGVPFVLYRSMSSIAGFAEGEMYLLLSFMFITEGMCNLLLDGIWGIPSLVFTGEFDTILIRPVSPLYQILSRGFGLHGLGVMALGLTTLVMALSQLAWLTPGRIALCLLFILVGTVLRASTYLIGACNVFWLTSSAQTNVTYMIYSIGEYAKYPVNLYPLWMQVILLVLIPFGFIGYVPVLLLRGENALLWGLAMAVMAVGYALVARTVFYRGIRRYESMGM